MIANMIQESYIHLLPINQFGQLLDISPNKFMFFKAFK